MTGTSTKDRDHIERFLGSGVDHPTLALVYGRRRIGKSTLLSRVAREHEGFYWEATRSATAVQLERLGEAPSAPEPFRQSCSCSPRTSPASCRGRQVAETTSS